MVVFGAIKRLKRSDLRHDGFAECVSGGQLLNVRLRYTLLIVRGVKNLGAVLSALVGVLTIQLRRIMHGEINL